MLLMINQFWSVSEVKWFYLVCLSIHDITATNTQLTSNSLLESKITFDQVVKMSVTYQKKSFWEPISSAQSGFMNNSNSYSDHL